MRAILKSKKASLVPGDTLRELTREAVDSAGRVWPAGSTYQPAYSGSSSQTVRFLPGGEAKFVSELGR